MQSGPPNCAYAKTEKHPAYYARTLASTFECDPKASTAEIYDCLNKLDSATLMHPNYPGDEFTVEGTKGFKPVIDDFTSKPFLPKDSVRPKHDFFCFCRYRLSTETKRPIMEIGQK